LQQEVLIHAEGVPLGDLFAGIDRKIGVRLRAVAEADDEKVVMVGPARPLRDYMEDLAALVDARWSRVSRSDPPAYMLSLPRDARDREDRLLRAAHERLLRQLNEEARTLALQAPMEGAGPAERDPEPARWFARPWLAMSLWLALTPGQELQLLEQKRLFVPLEPLVGRLPEPVREQLTNAVEHQKLRYDLAVAEAAREGGRVGPSQAFDDPRDAGKGWVHLELRHDGEATAVAVALRTRETGLPLDTLKAQSSWLLPPSGNPYTGERVPADARLPSAGAIAEAGKDEDWVERLKRLADAAGTPILADYYRCPPIQQASESRQVETPTKTASREALDALCARPGYLWWVRGKTLLMRKRDWFLQRRYEAPDRWMLAIIERLQRHGGQATYGDVAGLLELSDEQIYGLSRMALGGPTEAELAGGLRPLLGILNAPRLASFPVASSSSLSTEEARRIIVQFPGLDPAQLRDLGRLTAAVDPPNQPASPEGWQQFRAQIIRRGAQPGRGRSGYQFIAVDVSWRAGSDASGGFEVSLPLSLPDDRRESTRVVPAAR
jgi:hypothetical protein